MTNRRFLAEFLTECSTLTITGDEYHHLRHVNRAKCGDVLEVINGKGSLVHGEILKMDTNKALVQVIKKEKTEKPPLKIIIAPSLLKQRSMNLLIEKSSEIGVCEIRPILFTRTDESFSHSRLKKWQRIAAQSLKVNKHLWQTDIYPPVPLTKLIETSHPIKTKILLDISGTRPTSILQQFQFPAISVIGPPGDLTDEERQLLIEKNFIPYNINHAILKSETAAIAISAILQIISCGEN